MKEKIEQLIKSGQQVNITLGLELAKSLQVTNLDLNGVNLSYKNLKGAYLVDADLCNANLQGASFLNANLTGADLTGADLWFAYLDGTEMQDADLWGAQMAECCYFEAKNIDTTNAITDHI